MMTNKFLAVDATAAEVARGKGLHFAVAKKSGKTRVIYPTFNISREEQLPPLIRAIQKETEHPSNIVVYEEPFKVPFRLSWTVVRFFLTAIPFRIRLTWYEFVRPWEIMTAVSVPETVERINYIADVSERPETYEDLLAEAIEHLRAYIVDDPYGAMSNEISLLAKGLLTNNPFVEDEADFVLRKLAEHEEKDYVAAFVSAAAAQRVADHYEDVGYEIEYLPWR